MSEGLVNLESGSWFFGEFEFAVDAQRRVAIPSNWRLPKPQRTRFVVLPGRDRSLQLVPWDTFGELLQKLRRVSFADRQAQLALATIGSLAHESVCDGQGRVSLTPKLMEHAGIEARGKAVLLGAVTTIQLWHPEVWAERRMDSNACLDVIEQIHGQSDGLAQILQDALPKQ